MICPASLFESTALSLDALLHQIAQGFLALPAFARPLRWGARETAGLLDSLYRGYPAGVLVLWEYRPPAQHRALAKDAGRRAPNYLLVDGRQRLTALYCALRGQSPAAEGSGRSFGRLAFSPLRAVFAPSSQKIAASAEFITDIAGLWRTPSSSRKIAGDYLARLRQGLTLSLGEEERACANLDKLLDILHYPFPVVELPAQLAEREALAIFERLNQVKGGPQAARAVREAREDREFGQRPARAGSLGRDPRFAGLSMAEKLRLIVRSGEGAPVRPGSSYPPALGGEEIKAAEPAAVYPAKSFVAL